MKRLLSAFIGSVAVFMLGGCSDKGYEAKITSENSDGNLRTFYLLDNNKMPVDSVSSTNGTFILKGKTDSIFSGYLGVRTKGGKYYPHTRIFLQNGGNVNVTIGKEIRMDDNGGLNSIYSEFYNSRKENTNRYAEAVKEKNLAGEELKKFFEKYKSQNDSIWETALENNIDNPVGAAVLSERCKSIRDSKTFFDYLAKAKYANQFPELAERVEYFKVLEKTSAGKMFIDFSGKSVEGKDVKLSDYVGKGKYVVVDFWASWCKPCRMEIPNLINAEKKFGDKNFMVLGVNVWDKEDKFKIALKEEKINYPQIFVDNREVTNSYGISGIPQIILFGPDGKVLKRDLRGAAIEAAIKEYIKD